MNLPIRMQNGDHHHDSNIGKDLGNSRNRANGNLGKEEFRESEGFWI